MAIPQTARQSLQQRLDQRVRTRWPELAELRLRYRADFAYVDGLLADDWSSPRRPDTASMLRAGL